jgi:hypothetical protein
MLSGDDMNEESVHASEASDASEAEFESSDEELDAAAVVDARSSQVHRVAIAHSQPPPLPSQRQRMLRAQRAPLALLPLAAAGVLGAVLGGSVYAFAERAHARATARERQAAVELTPAPAAAAPVAAAEPAAKAPEPAEAKQDEAEDQAAAPVVTETPATPESKLLDSARALLEEGKAAKAKAALDQARRKFPKGALVEEREYLSIESLKALKKMPAARHAAQAFAKAHADSSHLADLEPLLGSAAK